VSAATSALIAGPIVDLDDYPIDIAWSSSADACVVAGGEGRLYCVTESGGVTLLGTQAPGLLSVCWQHRGDLVATAGQDGTVRYWHAQATEPGVGRILHRSLRWPLGLCFRPDGQRLAFAVNKDVFVFDCTDTELSEAPLLQLTGHSVPLTHLCWRGRDELIVVGNGALFVDRLDEGGKVTQFVLEGTPQNIALSSDLKIVAN
jgi:WD40 repeat protein